MTAIQTIPAADRTLADIAREFGEKGDERLGQLTTRVRQIKAAKVDAVANTRALTAIPVPAGDNHPAQVILQAGTNGGALKMAIGEVAHGQFSARLKIDKRYYDRMITEAPVLLAENLNYWLTNTPEDRLFRMLRPDAYDVAERRELASLDVQVKLRGVLGKGYRTIDDADLVDAILPTLIEKGAKLIDFSIDDRRMHAKFADEPRSVADIRKAYAVKYNLTEEQVRHHTQIDGVDISWVNEVLSTGVTIRHSEVGFASLGISMFQRVLKCLNDLVGENLVSLRHVGGKNNGAEDGDVRYLSDATQLMENAAMLGRAQDSIAQAFDSKTTFERAQRLLVAKVETVDRNETPLFEFVGNIGLNLGLTDAQTDVLKEETVKSITEEGGEVRFAFVQGITAVARQMTDYDRRLDVEHAAFNILNDDAGALLKLGRDAEKNAAKRKN